jgi:hypothetical protein
MGSEKSAWHVGEECRFGDWDVDEFRQHPCSPIIDDLAFRGIALNAPAEVEFEPGSPDPFTRAFTRIPLCGTCRFDYNAMGLDGEFADAVLLVATDAVTHETYSARMQSQEDLEPVADDSGEEMDLSGVVVQQYFNADLAVLLDLPAGEAEYIVFATLGEFKSNPVRLKVVAKK